MTKFVKRQIKMDDKIEVLKKIYVGVVVQWRLVKRNKLKNTHDKLLTTYFKIKRQVESLSVASR